MDLVTFTGEILNGKLHFLCSMTLFRNPEFSANIESSDNTFKPKTLAKRHEKNVEKSVAVLLNVSFIPPIKFFLLLHIEIFFVIYLGLHIKIMLQRR